MPKTKRKNIALLLLLTLAVPAWAFFPFSVGKQELKTDYSQTVWERIMLEQSVTDMRRGMGEMSATRYQAAANSFAKAVIKNPQDPLPHLLYGASLYWSGRVDSAMSEYREALRLSAQNPMAYQLLGIAWGWKGDLNQAQENFLRAAALAPDKADTQMNLGSTYAAQKQLEKALDHYRRAVELAPREPLYHYQLGALYDLMGRDAQAEASYKKALHYFSSYEDAQLALAALYEKRDNTDAALKYYKKAVKTKPGDFVARLRYAYLLMKLGSVAEARKVLDGAFSIAAFNADGLALNAVYRAGGRSALDFEKQINRFEQALLQVPASKDVTVEVALDYEPAAKPADSAGKSKFAEAYESMRASGTAAGETAFSLKRSFILAGGDEQAREEQVQALKAELSRAVSAAQEKYDVSMTLQGRTMDYASASALTQDRSAPPKAVYDPRIVGNDMGLWLIGKTWMKYVDEIEAELSEQTQENAAAEWLMLHGLAALLGGNASGAQAAFDAARERAQTDPLPLLGLGTAAVIAGDDSQALAQYRRALTLAPDNKTAKRNIAILEKL